MWGKSNEIKALQPAIKALAERSVVFAFDALNTQKKLVSKSSLQKIII
ncbi:hypothetical protein QUB08_30160 [Microcoleus sp. BR0-C5]